MSKNKLIIAGGSGFIGLEFVRYLAQSEAEKWDVMILSRSKPNCDPAHARWIQWDGHSDGDWMNQFSDATHVLNLAGKSIDCRKTPERRKQILRSRVDSTNAIGRALDGLEHLPKVWVQMSAAGIYGDQTKEVCTESSTLATGFLPDVVKAWEAAFDESCPDSVRRVLLRTNVVLGKSGGAYPILRRVAGFGLGGRLGSGEQGLSWIHIEDMNRVIFGALTNQSRNGIYNVAAPNPVSYIDFMRALRKVIKQPIALPGPAWGVRLLAATVLDTDPELILNGLFCVPERLLDEGFEFKFAEIESAFTELNA